jgi:hypothetical protein
MPTRIYHVPLLLAIDADQPGIALAEAERIRAGVEAEDRHLQVKATIPMPGELIPPFTLPSARIER